jgi:hypothetical protein
VEQKLTSRFARVRVRAAPVRGERDYQLPAVAHPRWTRYGLPRAWTGGHGYGQIELREEFRPRPDSVAAFYGAYLSGRPQ